jgi:hypothetical protein
MPEFKRPYSHLPETMEECFSDAWEYKGVRPTSRRVGPIMPTVAFSTVDLKVPAVGPVKILEINGYDSGLDAYGEELREHSIMERANGVNGMLGTDVARFRWDPAAERYDEIIRTSHPFTAEKIWDRPVESIDEGGFPLHFDTDLTATEAKFIGEWLLHRRRVAKLGSPATKSVLQTLEDASLVIELSDSDMPAFSDFDPADALIANPAEIRMIEDDKLAFDSLVRIINASMYRPRSGLLTTFLPSGGLSYDRKLLDEVEKVVLKFPKVDSGMGVTVLRADEMKTLISIATRLGTWDAMVEHLSGNGFTMNAHGKFYSRPETPNTLLVEEYIPSAPVKAPDGRKYDATMRIVISSLANREKVTVVPLGAYWKLPEAPIGVSGAGEISRVKEGGSLPVSEKDFRRAFRDVADFMRRVLYHTRTTKNTNYWPREPQTEN